jgi:glycosyltransferase involved in cell wall biosynthesis
MHKQLTIAFPTSSFLPGLGGVEVGLHNIAARLKQRGHRPVLMVPAPHHAALHDGWVLPYEVIHFPPKVWGLLRVFPAVGFAILDAWFEWAQRRYQFDVWHCTMGWPTGVALVHYARKWRPIPHLVRCAGEDIQREPAIGYGARLDPRIDKLVRHWLPQADCLVATTDTVATEYRAICVPEEHIARIPNGVDIVRLRSITDRAATRRRLGIMDDETVFLAVGRNHPKKGFATLLAAAPRLKAQGRKKIRIVIAGLGTNALKAQAVGLGVARETVLIEQIGNPAAGRLPIALPPDELVALYQAADIFVLPSIMETFGIVLVEAMAAGLPIITSDAPGCRDIVRKGQDGLLVPPGDSAALAAAMERVLGDAGLAADLRRKSLSRAQDFAWDDVVAQYQALYLKLISQNKYVKIGR